MSIKPFLIVAEQVQCVMSVRKHARTHYPQTTIERRTSANVTFKTILSIKVYTSVYLNRCKTILQSAGDVWEHVDHLNCKEIVAAPISCNKCYTCTFY